MTNTNSTAPALEALLEDDNISPAGLVCLKHAVYGNKGGTDALKTKIEGVRSSLKKTKDAAKLSGHYLAMGVYLLVLNKVDDALEAFDNVKPKKKANYFIGKCYSANGNYKDAIALFEQSLKTYTGQDAYNTEFEIALNKRRDGDAHGAKQIACSLLKTGKDEPDLHCLIGHCLDDIGEKQEAFDSYQMALDCDPDHAASLFRLAYNYDLNQMDTEAIEHYEMCNQLPVRYVNSYINLGTLYDDNGEYEKAVSCFAAVLKSYPNNITARTYMKDARMSIDMHYDETNIKTHSNPEDVLNIPISEFELSVRSRNCLEKMSINTLGDLTRVTEHDLLTYKNFGETSLYEIRNILKQKGLRLGQMVEGQTDDHVMLSDI